MENSILFLWNGSMEFSIKNKNKKTWSKNALNCLNPNPVTCLLEQRKNKTGCKYRHIHRIRVTIHLIATYFFQYGDPNDWTARY